MRARWRSVSGLAYRASDAIEPHAQGRNAVLAHNRAASDRPRQRNAGRFRGRELLLWDGWSIGARELVL
jgi:hypothetical protein